MTATTLESTRQFLESWDSRAEPRYTFAEAARYLRLPDSTIRSWFTGMTYGSRPNVRTFRPILKPSSLNLLSFYDIASAHVLMSLRSKGVTAENIRAVVESLEKEYPNSSHPLLGRDFFLFGRQVVIKQLGQLMNLSKYRQWGLKRVMERFLSRVEMDSNKMPVRFSPVRAIHSRGKGLIVIDPNLSCGRPVIRGTGIAAEIIAHRKESGESITILAKDYGITRRAVEEAIRYFDKAA